MANASTWEDLSPGLVQGGERAPRDPEERCHALAHRIDGPALARAYRRQRADAAGGVAGVTKEPYGQEEEVIRRMEAGEAPEQIAAAMGDLLEAKAPLCGVETKQGGKPVRPSSPRPQVDSTLYEL
jgi:hypothetical protein